MSQTETGLSAYMHVFDLILNDLGLLTENVKFRRDFLIKADFSQRVENSPVMQGQKFESWLHEWVKCVSGIPPLTAIIKVSLSDALNTNLLQCKKNE